MMPYVDDRDAVALHFADRANFVRAIEILYGAAHGRPYTFGIGIAHVLIVNRSDQHFFAGLAYTEEHVATPDEVSLEDLARIRAEHMRGE
jgi:hypothetical protein